MTPVESQACGRPVIAYAQGGALESVIEGITGHFFHQQSVSSLMKAVRESEELNFDPDVLYQWACEFDSERMMEKLNMFFLNISKETMNSVH